MTRLFYVWPAIAVSGGLALLHAQTSIDLRTQAKSVDFSSAAYTKPSKMGTVLPATCSLGETFFNSAAPAGRNLYGCAATNTWTLLGSNLWFGGGTIRPDDCAQFDSNGNLVSAGAGCGSTSAVTLSTPFATGGSLLVSAGAGRQGVASSCSDTGGNLSCPSGFTGRMTWPAATGTNSRQILGAAGAFTNSFNYRWSDTIPTAATLMKIGTAASGESSLGPAIPDTDYVTPSGSGTLQNKIFDGTSLFSNYTPWAQITTPTAPSSGLLRVYAKIGTGLCWINSSGAETCAGAAGSGASTLSDPGGTGMVVETSPGVLANRTIMAGSSNLSVTNGNGSAGNPTIDIGSTVNFASKTTSPVQVGASASMPLTCSAGQLYFANDGVDGRKLQTCTTANTWTTVGYSQGSAPPVACAVGQIYFNTAAAAGQNLYFCTSANNWIQMAGGGGGTGSDGVPSVYGRTGAISAQAGDYSYAQISNTPTSLLPNGAAAGDLSGSYPSPTVSQVNGAAIPSSGILRSNSSRQIVQAAAGSDYAPATSGSALLKGNGGGGFASAVAGTDYAPATTTSAVLKGNGSGGATPALSTDIVNLFAGCSGAQYLGADGSCHTPSAGSGSGNVAITTGSGAPSDSCIAPSTTNLNLYLDTTNGEEWWCYAANSWKKILSVTNTGAYQVIGVAGLAPATPFSGSVACYFDSTSNTQICIDSNGNAATMVRASSSVAHQFVANVDANGIQHTAQPAFSDLTGALSPSQVPNIPIAISTAGLVADPGGPNYYQYNNATGALAFNLPAGVAGMQRCYRNATGKSGIITIAVPNSNSIDLNGVNGTTSTGTLVSGGALGDAACVVSDTANHWYAYIQKGAWTNN